MFTNLMGFAATILLLGASAQAETNGVPICGRHISVQNEVLRQFGLSSFSLEEIQQSCKKVDVKELSRIRSTGTLNVGGAALKPQDFQGLSNVQELTLSDNSLGEEFGDPKTEGEIVLDGAVFAGMKNLKYLFIMGNISIKNPPQAMINSLEELRIVNLSGHESDNHPGWKFHSWVSELKALKELKLTFLELEDGEVPKTAFSNLNNLEKLDLSSNRFTRVPEAAKEIAGQLKSFQWFGRDTAQVLKANDLAKFKKVEYYYEHANSSVIIEKGAFNGFDSATNISISATDNLIVKEGAFAGARSLEKIELGSSYEEIILEKSSLESPYVEKIQMLAQKKGYRNVLVAIGNTPKLKLLDLYGGLKCSDKERFLNAVKKDFHVIPGLSYDYDSGTYEKGSQAEFEAIEGGYVGKALMLCDEDFVITSDETNIFSDQK